MAILLVVIVLTNSITQKDKLLIIACIAPFNVNWINLLSIFFSAKATTKKISDWIPVTRQSAWVIYKKNSLKKAVLRIALERCNCYLMFWLLDGGEVEQTLGILSSSVKHANVDYKDENNLLVILMHTFGNHMTLLRIIIHLLI